MTTLVSWIGVDSRAPTSAYIASDSRISWNKESWDFGYKTFASPNTPDVFGYSGDVVFPSLLLAQFCVGLESGIYEGDCKDRFKALRQIAQHSLSELPESQRRPFEIVHCGRDGLGMGARFGVGILKLGDSGSVAVSEPALPAQSAIVHLSGSGATAVERSRRNWIPKSSGGTTRAMFIAFVEALQSGADPNSGGGPQMVGLYRVGNGRIFGVHYRGRRYLGGGPVHPESAGVVDWRNERFERIDGISGELLPGAQSHR
jgi:hypothetical protein